MVGMVYRLRLLGPFELQSPSGDGVEVTAKKSQALVAILALAEGAPVPRSRLTAVLWGDRGEEQARSSLRQALTALRKTFGPRGPFPLAITEDTVAIDPSAIEADTSLLTADGDDADLGALWRGEFLDGLHIPDPPAQDWLRAERQRLASLYCDRLGRRIARLEAAGDAPGAIESAQALLRADPVNEPTHRALMRGFAATGDRSRALKPPRSSLSIICRV